MVVVIEVDHQGRRWQLVDQHEAIRIDRPEISESTVQPIGWQKQGWLLVDPPPNDNQHVALPGKLADMAGKRAARCLRYVAGPSPSRGTQKVDQLCLPVRRKRRSCYAESSPRRHHVWDAARPPLLPKELLKLLPVLAHWSRIPVIAPCATDYRMPNPEYPQLGRKLTSRYAPPPSAHPSAAMNARALAPTCSAVIPTL